MTNDDKLNAAVAQLEEFVGSSKEGIAAQWADTGERYVSIVSGGQMEEGEVVPAFATSPSVAIELWLDAAMKYAKTRSGVLHWRSKPKLTESKLFWADGLDDSKTVYVVFSRFLISDKPVLEVAA